MEAKIFVFNLEYLNSLGIARAIELIKQYEAESEEKEEKVPDYKHSFDHIPMTNLATEFTKAITTIVKNRCDTVLILKPETYFKTNQEELDSWIQIFGHIETEEGFEKWMKSQTTNKKICFLSDNPDFLSKKLKKIPIDNLIGIVTANNEPSDFFSLGLTQIVAIKDLSEYTSASIIYSPNAN